MGDPALEKSDPAAVSTVGAGFWRTWPEETEPTWRYNALMFNDLVTSDLYLMGGTVKDSNVSSCGGLVDECLDMYRRQGLAWEPVLNVAAPPDDLPPFVPAFSLATDISHHRVVGYDSKQRRLYQWSNQATPSNVVMAGPGLEA